MTAAVVLALNSGSSSLKFAVFRCARADGEARLAEGAVEGIGRAGGRVVLHAGDRVGAAPDPAGDRAGAALDAAAAIDRAVDVPDHAAALDLAFAALAEARLPAPDAVGHRIVHGGPHHHAPTRVDAALLAALRAALPFAPLHLPAELHGIDAAAARFPGRPQVVCFDTGFHHALPEVARRYPLARELADRGIRRYGFHGLSYEHLVDVIGAARLGRAVLAHLGSGASMAAVVDGAAVDTTMGLTPCGGLMMGTRTGDLDPGVLLHLMAAGADARTLERVVSRESGLLGVSGRTADVKELLARRDVDADAALALAMFCYHARKAVGALAAALGGLDTLVFTGGIGQRAAPVRAEICAPLRHLGVHLDERRNAAGAAIVSADGSPCTVRVVASDEERRIARHTARLCGGAGP